jgi:CysZ protein
MRGMLNAIALSFQSLSDRKILLILAKSIALTLIAFAAVGGAIWAMIYSIMQYWGAGDGAIAGIGTAIILFVIGAIVFRVLAVAIIWLFADQIVDHVEDRYYPDHAARRATPSFSGSIGLAIKSAARALGYNLLALPFYLGLLITGIGAPLLFLAVNAYLLGRDLQDMLIARHGTDHGKMAAAPRLAIGAMGSAAMMVPVVNLIIPVIATATVVHFVHSGGHNDKG